MKTTDLAWFAGFMDGEGTITARFQTDSHGDATKHIHYRALVANTNLEILEWVQACFGGHLDSMGKPRSPKHKQVRYVYWGGADAAALLRPVLPYLRIKRRQAELLLALDALAVPKHLSRFGVPKRSLAKRAKLVAEMVILNHRGVPEV